MTALRKIVRPIALGLMVAIGATVATTAVAAPGFKEPGKLIAGSDATFAPYEYMENNKPVGFDIEFINGLAKIMGRKVEIVDTRFANLITGLQGGRFDLAISALYVTEARLKAVDMIPYLKGGESILTLKGSTYQPKKFEDFCGHKIGSMAATAWLAHMQKVSEDYCLKNNLKPIAISVYPSDPETTQALLSHAVDAQITDAAVAQGVIEKLAGRVAVSSDTLLDPVLDGLAVVKGNDEVKAALIDALKKYKATPEYAALLKKYHFEAPTDDDIKALTPKI
jgi:polar amino acid transport system substrate-binding protein